MESASAMAAACSARLRRERATTRVPITRRDAAATAMIARKAQSGSPPDAAPEAEEEDAGAAPEAAGAAPEEEADAPAEAASAAAGAAMARASDAEAASPTAKRRVVEADTASPAVVVPRKVTVAV